MSQYECVTELEKWLNSYLNFEKTPEKNIFWLDTVEFFCKKLRHPEVFAPAFHIAGSKGKGSVSCMISSILEEAGYKTGLYTSPHILDFIERIGSAHGNFEEKVYKTAAEELKNCVESTTIEELPGRRPITWFELVTLYAFLCFRQAKTDFNVFEVGLGGRLDATNVIKPLISIITPIELEHTQFLGDTIAKIAGEKAGIIKNGVPVICAGQTDEAKQVFIKTAREKNTEICFIDDLISDLDIEYNLACIKNNTGLEKLSVVKNSETERMLPLMKINFSSPLFSRKISACLKLPGEFQAWNASLAACAVKMAVPSISEDAIEQGLEKACLPGRFEIVRPSPSPASDVSGSESTTFMVLDGAHTVNSVRFTMQTFNKIFGTKKAHLLFACAADKDMNDIALLFKNRFERITITKPGEVKQSDIKTLENAFNSAGLSFTKDEDYKDAIKNAVRNAAKDNAVLLVTGSFYLVSEVKHILVERA